MFSGPPLGSFVTEGLFFFQLPIVGRQSVRLLDYRHNIVIILMILFNEADFIINYLQIKAGVT